MGTDPVGLPLLPLLLAPNSATFFFPTTFFFLGRGVWCSKLGHLAAQGAGRANRQAGSRFPVISKGEAVRQETGSRREPRRDVSAPFPAQLGEGAGHPSPTAGVPVPLLERAWQPTPCPGHSLAHSSGPFCKRPQIQHDTPLNQCTCQHKGKPNTPKPRVLNTGYKEGGKSGAETLPRTTRGPIGSPVGRPRRGSLSCPWRGQGRHPGYSGF